MKIKTIIKAFAGVLCLGITACSPDSYTMESVPNASSLVDGTDYSINVNPKNSNQVILKNNVSGTSAYWTWSAAGVTGEGYVYVTTSRADTITLGFANTYTFKLRLEGQGGLSEGSATKNVTISTYALSYMNDSEHLWNNLCGGAGKSKTWVLDLDASGKSYYFQGPLYFYGTSDRWDNVSGNGSADGKDSWNWCPSYSGNTWLMTATNYGTMTFASITSHLITTVRPVEKVTSESGSYTIDTLTHKLTIKNTSILMDIGRTTVVTKRGDCKILSLTDSTMQLGVLRDNDSTQDPCELVYNYISKAYYDKKANK